ncbi:MAG: DNA-binding protein [bacterium]|nr:DNA-binding protein [bacterium]
MMTKVDLEKLALLRLEDSILLLQATRFSSAYYLAGYAVELALKACIAKLVQPNTIPDKAFVNAIYVHKLDSLLGTAGLRPAFDSDSNADPQLAAYWAIANNWSEESRYAFWDPFAAASLIQSIYDPDHGVFQWVKKHW